MTDLIFKTDDVLNALQRALSVLVGVATEMDLVIPTRQLTSTAGAIYDCEQVSISSLSIQTGFPEPTGAAGTATYPLSNITLWTLRTEIAVVRNAQEHYVGSAAPTPTMLLADLTTASADGALLGNTAMELVRAIGAPVPHSIAFTQTQGGLLATTAQITFPLWEF